MKKILVIGCGHMGSALVTSWINSKKYSLTDAAQAHKDLEARLLTGPAVIIP